VVKNGQNLVGSIKRHEYRKGTQIKPDGFFFFAI
jgi:hypothetical protein